MDLDTFFVSVERLRNSALVGKPILIGGSGDRAVVASCSYETRHYGVRSGMPMRQAMRLCPEALLIRGDAGIYSKYSKLVTQVVADTLPVYEKSSIDEFYMDLTGMDRFFGCFKIMQNLKQRIIHEVGLPISFGLSGNKTVSKIATGEGKPLGEKEVPTGTEKPFLAPLSVRKIPGVGGQTYKTLRGLGIAQIHTVQQMPPQLMQSTLGQNGLLIWKKANGIDDSRVEQYHERKSISTERTFEQDTIDVPKLQSMLLAMAENLAYQLRKGQKLTSCISVKIRYSDFVTENKQLHIPYTSADHLLIPKVLQLFNQLYNRRMLVRLIGVRYSSLVQGSYQINLFEDSTEMINLYQAMDKIRNRYGEGAIKRAYGLGVRSIGRGSNPFDGQAPMLLPNRRS